jgi:hypothetical protein
VPCAQGVFAPINYNKRYTARGEHSAAVPGVGSTNTFLTYDTLGFMAAGTTAVFYNIPLGAFSDFRNAAPPNVYAVGPGSLSGDGSSASYVQRLQDAVTVQVTVPYSAKKGLHQVTFPTTDKYGYAASNGWFSFVVYDRTPSIISVSPTSIPVGMETALTITGTGFGDRPTVFVGGVQYDNGTLSTDAQGREVVTVRVTLPSSSAGTTQQVSVRSNGSGGQPFSGAPLNGSLGSATSNSMQVQAVNRVAISGSNAIWFLSGLGAVCNTDDSVPAIQYCYYDTTQLSVVAPAGAAVTWTVTPVYPATSEASTAWGCADSQCSKINLSSIVRPSGVAKLKSEQR